MEAKPGYQPIELDPVRVPEAIRVFVGARVEPYLRDVRWMMAASPPGPTLNWSIASMLCSVIGGLAVVFHNDITADNKSFKATASLYPLHDEPPAAIRDPTQFGEELYDVFRCTLVHNLGLHMDRASNKDRWSIVDVKERYVVARTRVLPLSEQQLRELDEPSGRPGWLASTLERQNPEHAAPTKIRLDADALYWGVRRVVRTLATDPVRQAIAAKVLEQWFQAYQTPHRTLLETASSTPPQIVTSHFAMDATLGATTFSDVSSYWGPPQEDAKQKPD